MKICYSFHSVNWLINSGAQHYCFSSALKHKNLQGKPIRKYIKTKKPHVINSLATLFPQRHHYTRAL